MAHFTHDTDTKRKEKKWKWHKSSCPVVDEEQGCLHLCTIFFFFFLWHRAWEKYFKTAVQTRKLHTIRLSANWGMGGYSTKCIYTFSWLTTEFRITSLLEAMWILLPSFYLSDEKDIYSILSHQSHFYCSHMVYYRIVLSTSHCTRNSSMKIASEH